MGSFCLGGVCVAATLASGPDELQIDGWSLMRRFSHEGGALRAFVLYLRSSVRTACAALIAGM